MKKQNILISLLFSLILFSALFTTLFKVEANVDIRVKENKYAQTLSNEPTMTAGLYSEVGCTDESKVLDLTNEGAEYTDSWDYDETRYLLVDLSNLDSNKKYRVKIDMDQALYADIIELPDVSDNDYIDKIEFTKNESITYNKNNEYNLKTFSGDFTYYISKGVTIYSFILQLRYDSVLWNKLSNSTINGYSETELLKVTFEEIVDDSTDPITTNELNSVKMLSVVTGEGLNPAPYCNLQSKDSNNFTGSGASLTISPNLTAQLNVIMSPGVGSRLTLFEQVKIYIQIPYCEESESINSGRMIYDGANIGDYGYGEFDYDIEVTEQQIIITYNNLFCGESRIGQFYFTFPEEYSAIIEKYRFSTNIVGTIFDKGEEKEVYNANFDIYCNNLNEANLEQANFEYNNGTVYTEKDNVGVVQLLGMYGIKNTGKDSGEVLVRYNFDVYDTKNIFVTTLSMHPDKVSEYINVKYSLIDENGDPVIFDKNTGDVIKESDGLVLYDDEGNLLAQYTNYWYIDVYNTVKPNVAEDQLIPITQSILFHRGMLISEHQGYYFKSIEYILGEIEAGTTLFCGNSPAGYESVGNYWGYVREDATNSYVHSEASLYYVYRDEVDNSISNLIFVEGSLGTNKTHIGHRMSVPYGISSMMLFDSENTSPNDSVTELAITAGESFKVIACGYVVPYSYSGNNILNTNGNNIRFGIILPSGASVNEDSITLINGNYSNDFELLSLTYYPIDDGFNMWVIDVKADDGSNKATIGYASEKLGYITNTDLIRVSFIVDTKRETNPTTIHFGENLFFTARNMDNSAYGSYSYFRVLDEYDLNSNGSTEDYISSISKRFSSTKLEIQAYNASLDISTDISAANISEEGELYINNNYDEEGNMVSDYIQYDLKINCTEGGSVDGFVYFIPIVKNGSVIDEYLVYDNNIDLTLAEIPIVNNSLADYGVKIEYTTSTNFDYLTYSELKKSVIEGDTTNAVLWSSDFDELNSLDEITMIKVVSLNDTIVNGSESVVSLKLKYSGDDLNRRNLINLKSKFSSYGYYVYKLGNRNAGGHFGTELTTCILGYTGKEITATIVLNSEDAVDNGNMTYTTELILFKDVKDQLYLPTIAEGRLLFRIRNLELHNVNIVKAIDETEDASYANSNFVISANLYDFESTLRYRNLYYYRNNEYVNLMNKNANKEYGLALKMVYLNKITDNFTDRYITFTVESEDGHYVQPFKIIIERNLTEVTDAQSSIAAGKFYQIFSSTDITTFTTCSASVTAQFILKDFVYANYGEESISFSTPLVANSTILMIDCTNNDYKYYYYKFSDESITTVNLTDFYAMGTDTPYTNDGDGIVDRKMLFIIDYPEENTSFDATLQEITYLIEPSIAGVEELSNKLTYSIVNDLTYSLDVTNPSVDYETNNIDLVISTTNQFINADQIDNGFSLVLKATEESYIPADAYILYNNKKYSANANGEFIVPLFVDKTILENSVSLKFNSNMLLNTDICELVPMIYLSSTFDGERPYMGMLLATGSNISLKKAASTDVVIKVEEMSDRALNKEDLKEQVVVKLSTLNCENKGNITVELQELDAYGYVIDMNSITSVNGISSREDGMFDITSVALKNGSLSIKLSINLPVNKYQLVFKVFDESNENVIYTYTYKFIVYE